MLSSLELRYIRILELIADGHTTKEIAQLLGLSHQTVDTYIKELKRELASEPEAHGRLPNRAGMTAIYKRLTNPEVTSYDSLDRLDSPGTPYEQLLTFSRHLSEAATTALWSGNPKLTVRIVSSASQHLEFVIQQLPENSEYRGEFLNILIEMLILQGRAYSHLTSFHANWCLATGFDTNLNRIAAEYGRRELESIAGYFLSDAYFITGDYASADASLQRAFQASNGLDDALVNHQRCMGLLIRAKIWGERARWQEKNGVDSFPEKRELWAVTREIEETLAAGFLPNHGDQAFAYGSLACAMARLHLPAARDYLDKTRLSIALSHQTGQNTPVRDIKLIDDEFVIRRHLDPGSTLVDLEDQAVKGITQATFIGCSRLVIRLQNWLRFSSEGGQRFSS